MRDYISIGSTPSGEECQQIGQASYDSEKDKLERLAFAAQLARMFPNIPQGVTIVSKSFPHDFGSYREVCVCFDADNEEQADYAYNIENNAPEKWDEEALFFLKEKGYFN